MWEKLYPCWHCDGCAGADDPAYRGADGCNETTTFFLGGLWDKFSAPDQSRRAEKKTCSVVVA